MASERHARPALVARALSKSFRLPHEKVHTLKERAVHPFRRVGYDRLEALREVSFEVAEGEFFGIVGRNGSGKSTLLKTLAGIHRADSGEAWVRGRLAPFIELGVGFNPELAARDNVLLNAMMLGLSLSEARARYDEIVAFAELEDFVNLKLKNYSSGMQVRLAFAVMAQADAEVLLIDEVLAVGDARFQQKCLETLNRRREMGRAVLFVTHDMGTVEQVCDRAMLLDHGRVVAIDSSAVVARRYNELNFGAHGTLDESVARLGDGSAQILTAWFEDEAGESASQVSLDRPCCYRFTARLLTPLTDPSFGVALTDDRNRQVFATGTAEPTGSFEAGEHVAVTVELERMLLVPGRYWASPAVLDPAGKQYLDMRPRATPVLVKGQPASGGLVALPHNVSVRREHAGAGAVGDVK